ncbi:CHAT domain-containing protein [Flavobacteriales bacterium]|nr:CHAT domain-containing protein [Flavobacteriales bacterium]
MGLVFLLTIKVDAQVQQELDACLRCLDRSKAKDCIRCQNWVLGDADEVEAASGYPAFTWVTVVSKTLAENGLFAEAQEAISEAPRLLAESFDDHAEDIFDDVNQCISTARQLGQLDEALQLISMAESRLNLLAPDRAKLFFPELMAQRIMVYKEADDADGELETLRTLIEYHRTLPESKMLSTLESLAGQNLFKQQAYSEALLHFQRAQEAYALSSSGCSQAYLEIVGWLAWCNQEMRRYDEEVRWREVQIECRRTIFGDSDTELPWSLAMLALSQMNRGLWVDADVLAHEALWRSKELPKSESDILNSVLTVLAKVHAGMEQDSLALALELQRELLFDNAKTTDTFEYAVCLGNIASYYHGSGDNEAATAYVHRSLEVIHELYGRNAKEAAAPLNLLGLIHQDLYDYVSAEGFLIRSLRIREESYGMVSIQRLESLNNLGLLYFRTGDVHAADSCLTLALDIHEELYGMGSVQSVDIVQNLADVLMEFDQSRAKAFAFQGERLSRKLRSQELLSRSCVQLAEVHFVGGELEIAEKYAQAGVAAARTVSSQNSLSLSLNTLGLVESELGKYQSALSNLQESLSLREIEFGKEHPIYESTLHNLTSVYYLLGDVDFALKLAKEAMGIRIKYGAKNLDYLNTLSNFSEILYAVGSINESIEADEEIVKLGKELLRPDHRLMWHARNQMVLKKIDLEMLDDASSIIRGLETDLVEVSDADNFQARERQVLSNKALLLKEQGLFSEALKTFEKSLLNYSEYEANERLFLLGELGELELLTGDSSTALDYFKQRFELSAQCAEALESSLDERLRETAYLNHIDFFKRTLELSIGSEDEKLMDEWITLRNRDIEVTRDYMSALADSENEAVKELLEAYDEIKKEITALQESGVGIVDSALLSRQMQESTIERELIQRAKDEEKRPRSQGVRDVMRRLVAGEAYIDFMPLDSVYAALVITAEESKIITLNTEEKLSSELNFVMDFIEGNKSDAELALSIAYETFWSPLARELQGVSTLYLNPDGAYVGMNLGVLVNPETGRYLMDEIALRYVSSISDVVNGNAKPLKSNREEGQAILFGDPAFSSSVLLVQDSRQVTQGAVKPLPFTRIEVNEVGDQLKVSAWNVKKHLGKSASEENLASVQAPELLHIATHGFFLSPLSQLPTRNQNPEMSNPMFRSGLLLSGANDVGAEQQAVLNKKGWFTAAECSNLELNGTELVVLSACETGRGKLQAGRGAFGLQRAFRIAGADAVLLSMWSVDDLVTSQLMVRFYEHWLDGNSASEALELAQQEIRKQYPHPYYWGAWICYGD